MTNVTLRFAFATLIIASSSPATVSAETALYVNLAPDIRYENSNHDSRISFLRDRGIFSFGHDFGKLKSCSDSSGSDCVVFDFMAIKELPSDVKVGSRYKEGLHEFVVARKVDLSLAGRTFSPYRVEVTKDGKPANAYLFDVDLGVIGINIINFDNKNIPESLYFLSGERGIFAESKVSPRP